MDRSLLPSIRDNFIHVSDQIVEATIRSGRVPGSVKLVTVTKSQPVEVVREAIAAGATLLGENYVNEALAKKSVILEKAIEWHMIGHLQSRKAELAAINFDMIHSVDSAKLAERLDRFCADIGRNMPILLEVNVSGETSKSGLPALDKGQWGELESVIEKILAFPNLQLRGLMTMPPLMDDPEQTRPYFRHMRLLQNHLQENFPKGGWKELSMGTSADFVAAIEEGATIVRVGRSIFGTRPTEKPG